MAEKKGKKKNSAKKLISGLFAKKKTNKPTQNGRKKTKNSRRETIIIVILTLLAVGAVVFFAARSFGGMKYNDVEDSAKQLISASGTGAGYPYKISSADVLDMTPFKSNIALLTRDSVVVLNSSAKEVARLEHNYSDPDMAVYKGRALVYDRMLGAGTVLTCEQADRAMAAGASFIVAPGFDPEVCKHVIDKGGIMMPGTASAGEMQQAMNMGCEALKFFPAEANGGVGMLKNIGAALKGARWMCTGGVNAKNVNDYLGYDQIFAVGGTWMCKSDVIKAGDWAKITAQSKEAVDTMLGLRLHHVGINTGNEEEAMKVATLLGGLLNMKVAPGNSSIFVGNKEFEIMKKPGRGTNGHIAIACNNVDRAIYHLSQRGVKFDLDSKNVKNGKTIACYFADEIAGFAMHLVQA